MRVLLDVDVLSTTEPDAKGAPPNDDVAIVGKCNCLGHGCLHLRLVICAKAYGMGLGLDSKFSIVASTGISAGSVAGLVVPLTNGVLRGRPRRCLTVWLDMS